jgi:hypothetical protein
VASGGRGGLPPGSRSAAAQMLQPVRSGESKTPFTGPRRQIRPISPGTSPESNISLTQVAKRPQAGEIARETTTGAVSTQDGYAKADA